MSRVRTALLAALTLVLLTASPTAARAQDEAPGSTPAPATTPTPAPAASPVRFGISDQHPAMFTDPRWRALDLRLTRYNVPWNAASDPYERARVVAFVTAARAAGVETLVHLTGIADHGIPEPLPSRAAYRLQARRLVALLRPLGVRTWGVWNEANHNTQPTMRHADRAAQFFLDLRAACIGCQIVAVDVLTQGGPGSKGTASYRGYLGRFFAALGTRRWLVRIVGIHNYGELVETKGAFRSRDLTRFARRFSPRARFWITESGGLAASRTRACSESRQVTGTRRMFSHARALAPNGVDRLYMYNWTAHRCEENFDSGLIRDDGSARPALAAIRKGAGELSR